MAIYKKILAGSKKIGANSGLFIDWTFKKFKSINFKRKFLLFFKKNTLEFKEYKMKYCKIKIFCFAFCPNFHQFKIMNIFI